ncbi:PQQ-binding-like beta-propeller repeat protein [Natronosalvus amylolyticus]|uniref:outer membrane protein assembly factor BamB family protein n=1 Tax=Natronosalvus amylolyticus TaxID=2961994 RepID=UPI0020C98C5B|nr:PQQ-binding-like beta-propeller repeat protein [Natronosalvus amylolyticus]
MSQSRHYLASLTLILLVVIGCTALLASGAFAASEDEIAVNVSVDETRVDVGETVDYEIVVENADSVGAYALEIDLSNTETTALLEVEPAGEPLYETEEPVIDDGTGTLDIVYGDDVLTATEDEIVIATGTLEVTDEGLSNLEVTVQSIGDEDGASYEGEGLTDAVELNSEPLHASFDVTPTAPVEGEPVTLDASASTPADVTYQWNSTGDPSINTTTTDPELAHVFDAAGEYDVTLTVIEPDGTTDTTTQTIDVEFPYVYEPLPTEPGAELWNFSADGSVVAAPTVVDGVAYIGSYGAHTSEGYVYAVDTTDGSELWRFTDIGGPVGDAPTVVDGTVYFGSDDDNLYAVDAADGTEQWNYTTDGSVTSPTVEDGVVYAASRDEHIYAVYADNGTEKWNVSTDREFRNTAPAVVDGTVYIGNYDGKIFALEAETGTEQWNYTTGSLVTSVPTVVDETVYVASWDDHLYALNASTGEREWRFKTGGLISSSPTVANGTVFLGGYDDTLYAIDPETGEEKWSTTTHGSVTSPTVMGEMVYVGSYDGNANTGAVHGISADDGTIAWTFEPDHEVRSAPTVVDGVVYVGSNDDHLYALYAAPAGSSTDSRVLQQALGHHEYDTVVPSFAIEPMPPRPGEPFTVDGGYSTATDDIVEYRWDFTGDGTVDETTTDPKASHSFDERGNYDVTLKVEDESGHTAQTTRPIAIHENGTITGTVTDPSGELALDGATVQLLEGDELVATTETDADGTYHLEARAGVYHLRANADGYGAVTETDVEIGVDGQETTQSVALQTDMWQFTTDERVFSSPTVVDGVAYVGSDDDTIYAIDTDTETELWSFETNESVQSSPAVVDGTVYIGSFDGNIYALNATNGTEAWRFETDGVVFTSPSVADGIVVAGSNDGNLYALDAETGTELWRFQTDGDLISPSPTIDDGTIYAGAHGYDHNAGEATENWYAIDLETGVEQWHQDFDGLGWYSEGSATVADGTVYVGSYDGSVYALDADDGRELWDVMTDGSVYSTPTVAEGTVYVGSYDGTVYALDADDGSDVWDYTTDSWFYSSATVADDTLYVGGGDGTVYALDAADGSDIWNYTTDSSIYSSPTVADGTVYIGSDDGNLYALKAGVSGSSVDSRVQLGTLGHIAVEHEDDPVAFEVSGLSTSIEIDEPGDEVSISATVENVASESSTRTVEIHFDGTVLESQEVTLGPGETYDVAVTLETDDLEHGEQYLYEVIAGNDSSTGMVSVASTFSDPSPEAPDDVDAVLDAMDGDGTPEDPYVIKDDHDLQAMNADPDAHYVLGSDIGASLTGQWNDGDGFEPVGDSFDGFTGHFDGAGHTINGLTIDGSMDVGLFSQNGGMIENVHLEDVDITGSTPTGALAGRNTDTGEIHRASSSGDVTGTTNRAGGLVGSNQGNVTQSFSSADVFLQSNVFNGGGLAGQNDGTISQSYATGDVTGAWGSQGLGGLVGQNGGDVINSYATGTVDGSSDNGGLVAYQIGSVTGSYWDIDATGQSTASSDGDYDGVTGLETTEMIGDAAGENMSALDFETTWLLTESYPELEWQSAVGDGDEDDSDEDDSDEDDSDEDDSDEDDSDEDDSDEDDSDEDDSDEDDSDEDDSDEDDSDEDDSDEDDSDEDDSDEDDSDEDDSDEDDSDEDDADEDDSDEDDADDEDDSDEDDSDEDDSDEDDADDDDDGDGDDAVEGESDEDDEMATSDDDDGGSSDSLPGFGFITAVLALLAAGMLGLRKRE